MAQESSDVLIERFFAERASRTDQQVLAELEKFLPLPDGDPDWRPRATWERACLFVALAELAAARRLRPAAALLLERACCGDPGELMRGLRHSLEAIFDPDWEALAEVCERASRSSRSGARLWAVHELGVLRSRATLPAVLARLTDEVTDVRDQACQAARRLMQAHPAVAGEVRAAAEAARERFPRSLALARLEAETGIR